MENLKVNGIPKELKIKIKKAQEQYLIAKAELETVEFIEHENITKILANNTFTDDEGKRVLNPEEDFLIKREELDEFLELLFIENKNAGLAAIDKETAIDWKYEKRLKEIEKELFDLQLETVPNGFKKDVEKAQNHYKFKDKALDLILRLDCNI